MNAKHKWILLAGALAFVLIPLTAYVIIRTINKGYVRQCLSGSIEEPITVVLKEDTNSQGASSFLITDPAEIKAFGRALNNATPATPNHPTSRWSGIVSFQSGQRDCTIVVTSVLDGSQILGAENAGTLVYIYSNRDQGVLLATVRSDAIGEIIKKHLNCSGSHVN